jgi:hypothetical protein
LSGYPINQDLAEFGPGFELPTFGFVDLPKVEN